MLGFYIWLQVTAVAGLRELVRYNAQDPPPDSLAIGGQALMWPAEDKAWPSGGRLGMQLELSFGGWMNFAVRKTFEATTSLFLRNTIIDKVNEKGLRVDVETSHMIWSDVRSMWVFPLFVQLQGISDFDAFNRQNLEAIKVTLLENCLEGQVGPGGNGYATDAEPLKVRLGNDPLLGDAFKSANMKNFSSLQLQMDLQFLTKPLESQGVEGAALAQLMWEKVAGEVWETANATGVDIFIASIPYTQAHLAPRVFGYDEARPYAEGGAEKCIFAPDFDIAQADDGKVSFYYSDGKNVLGMRAVLTIFSINEYFAQNLPDIRNQMMPQMIEDLIVNLKAEKDSSSCTPCGWAPRDPRMPPLPHDSATCGSLPN